MRWLIWHVAQHKANFVETGSEKNENFLLHRLMPSKNEPQLTETLDKRETAGNQSLGSTLLANPCHVSVFGLAYCPIWLPLNSACCHFYRSTLRLHPYLYLYLNLYRYTL